MLDKASIYVVGVFEKRGGVMLPALSKGAQVKKALIFLAVVLLSMPAQAEDLVERTVLNGKVTLMTPANFGPMTKEMLEIKYPAARKPSEVLTDSTGGVTLAFKHTETPMSQDQVLEAHQTMSDMFHNLYPSAEWFRDETFVKGGSNFIALELITPAIDTQIHNIMYGTSVEGRFLLVAFNTTVEQSEEWLPVGKKIMESIVINE